MQRRIRASEASNEGEEQRQQCVGRISSVCVQASAVNQGAVARAARPLAVGSPSGLAKEVRNVNHTSSFNALSWKSNSRSQACTPVLLHHQPKVKHTRRREPPPFVRCSLQVLSSSQLWFVCKQRAGI